MSKQINVGRVKATARRRTKVTLNIPNEEGAVEQTEVTLVYRGVSMNDSEALPETEGLEGDERNEAISKQLAFFVEEIPEFVGDDGRPAETDEQFFKEMDVDNVTAISAALRAAREVPTSPTAS